MDTFKKVLMQQIVKVMAPTSPAYGNGSNLPFVKQQTFSQLQGSLQVGDIIFTKTNNSIYQLSRRFLDIEYDHVSVVINKKQVIHISPPIISKIQIQRIIHSSRQPLILRVNFSAKQGSKQTFLSIIHNFLGEKYNELAIPTIFKNNFSKRLQKLLFQSLLGKTLKEQQKYSFSLQSTKYSKICSQAVLYAICRGNQKLANSAQQYFHNNSRYSSIGYILPDQLMNFLKFNQAQIIYNGVLSSQNKNDRTALDSMQIVLDNYIINKIQELLDTTKVYSKLTYQMLKTNIQKLQLIIVNQQSLKRPQTIFQVLSIIKALYTRGLIVIPILVLTLHFIKKQLKSKQMKMYMNIIIACLEIIQLKKSKMGRNLFIKKLMPIKPKL